MKRTIILTSVLAMGFTAANADVLGEWTFNNRASVATALESSNLDAGVSTLSSLQFNSSGGFGFDVAGPNNVPNTINDGYGFGGNSGEDVAFIHRATYFDGSAVPSPRPTADHYTSFGAGAGEGTGAALGNGNAPISFTITAGAQDVQVDSLTIDTTAGNAPLIVSFQEAGASVGNAVTLNGGNLNDTSVLSSAVVVGAGQTKTFTINLNSGSLDSAHIVNEFVLNGSVIPEPGTLSMIGAIGVAVLFIRRRFMM